MATAALAIENAVVTNGPSEPPKIFRLSNPETGEFWLLAANTKLEAATLSNAYGFKATKIRATAYFRGCQTPFSFSMEEEEEFPARIPF